MKKRQNFKSGVSPLIDISNKLNSYFSSIQQNYNGNLPEFYNLTIQRFYIDLNPEIIKIFLNRLKITHTFGTGIPSSMLKLLSNYVGLNILFLIHFYYRVIYRKFGKIYNHTNL